jgi:hypothetical protein
VQIHSIHQGVVLLDFLDVLSRVNPLGRFATTKLAGGDLDGPQVVAGDNLGAATRKRVHPAARSLISTGLD